LTVPIIRSPTSAEERHEREDDEARHLLGPFMVFAFAETRVIARSATADTAGASQRRTRAQRVFGNGRRPNFRQARMSTVTPRRSPEATVTAIAGTSVEAVLARKSSLIVSGV
jgi:hypothetical protein